MTSRLINVARQNRDVQPGCCGAFTLPTKSVSTLAHLLGLWGGTLDTSFAYQRFHTFIGAQGPNDEIVTPEGNQGNYFGTPLVDGQTATWYP